MTKSSMSEFFEFIPADCDQVDDMYKLISNPKIGVQVCAYGGQTEYMVSEEGEDDDGFYVADHGLFNRLSDAQRKAIDVANAAA